ncbi:hypothetical protein [Acidovorax sp.]|uniref:hypothetical protein n=1 Tax=Acidovorax sp. TaxID=1872122 RepID=UPI003CFD0700
MNQPIQNKSAATQSAPALRLKDKIGRVLMTIVVLLTLAAFADGVHRMVLAGPDRIWVETWRTFGYVVFVGLFALLALRPRNMPALWELVMGHKLAVSIYGLWLGSEILDAAIATKIDLVLVSLIALAWVLCRGWMAWSVWRAADPIEELLH